MANELTTIQISKIASEKLKALADAYKRSKTAHAEWLIDQDYEKLAVVKLIEKVEKLPSSPTLPPNGGRG